MSSASAPVIIYPMEKGGRLRLVQKQDKDGARPPAAIFIEDVPQFCAEHGWEETARALTEAYNSFKLTHAQFTRYQESMEMKVPEIEKALELIGQLRGATAPALTVRFPLTEGLFGTGQVEDRRSVFLWLGANLMVEFPLEEAAELLERNLANARKNIETYQADIEYLKDQQTIIEVNMSRVHNHRVQTEKAKAAAST